MCSQRHILEFQYSLLKGRAANLVRWMSSAARFTERQASDLMLRFHPTSKEMKQVFQKIDGNGDGKISVADLRSLLQAVGKDTSEAEESAAEMVGVADLNGDGFIDWSEFMEVHSRGIRMAEIQNAFWAFDTDGDGRISAGEVQSMLRRLGEAHSMEECMRMVRRVDRNGDDLVDMDDFLAMMTRTMKPKG